MPLKHAVTATGTNDAGKQVSVNAWNQDHSVVNGVDFPSETPAAPAASNLRLFGRSLGGRMMACFKSADDPDNFLQPFIGDGLVTAWLANNGTTSLTTIAGSTPTTTGTATNGNVALTSKIQSISAVEFLQTTAATTNVASFRYTAAQWVRGNSTGGGFFFYLRCGVATGASNTSNRFFIGMRAATAAPTDVNPSTQVNCIGFGWDDADTNCQIFTNDGTGTATKTDMGASWAVPTTDRGTLYDVFIWAPRNASAVSIMVMEIGAGTTYSSSFSADIPAQTTYLAPTAYASVGGVSSVIGIRFGGCYLESLN